jgi:intein/homing endonuclease
VFVCTTSYTILMGDLLPTQWAYLAGIIDGEGGLLFQAQKIEGRPIKYSRRVQFYFATLEPLRTVCEWLDIPYRIRRTRRIYREGVYFDTYRAEIPSKKLTWVLTNCLPYLTLKKNNVKILIQVGETNSQEEKERLYQIWERHAWKCEG